MMEFVNSIIDVEREEINPGQDPHPFLRGDVEEFFRHVGNMPDVLRANVYLPNGTIAWSTDNGLIGRRFSANEELRQAFQGELSINMGVVGEHEKEEHLFLPAVGHRFVESYLPIWDDQDGLKEVEAIIEVYRAPRYLFTAIESGVTRVWVSAGLGGLFVFVSLYWIVRRATRIMRAQEHELVETQMLAAMGEMASAVAHSLRNPLASIRSSAELADRVFPDKRVPALLADIMMETDRVDTWVSQYLAQTQPEASDETSCDVRMAVATSVHNFSREIERRDLHLSIGGDGGIPAARLSGFLLVQVLNGLLANAIEATPNGGDIHVATEAEANGGPLRITVRDSGNGVPEQELGRIFEPFTTTKSSGLGLGLPIARKLVRRYGGELGVSNRDDGKGAVATLMLERSG